MITEILPFDISLALQGNKCFTETQQTAYVTKQVFELSLNKEVLQGLVIDELGVAIYTEWNLDGTPCRYPGYKLVVVQVPACIRTVFEKLPQPLPYAVLTEGETYWICEWIDDYEDSRWEVRSLEYKRGMDGLFFSSEEESIFWKEWYEQQMYRANYEGRQK